MTEQQKPIKPETPEKPKSNRLIRAIGFGMAFYAVANLAGIAAEVSAEALKNKAANAVLKSQGFEKVRFADRFRFARCEDATGPAKEGSLSVQFEHALSSDKEHLAGVVCFDKKLENAEIVFDKRDGERPNIAVPLKKQS